MTYTPVEIIALILIITSTIKITVVLISPKTWLGFAKRVWGNSGIVRVVCLILAIIVFYYLIMAGVTVIEILAVAAFVALTIAVGLGQHVEDLIKHYEKIVKKRSIIKEHRLYIILWLILLLWGLRELLM
ncbi:MAG: hypothetical protein AABW81_02545 [Nanoarchaeota archaeon]